MTDELAELDPELAEIAAMSDEQLTLHLARHGMSPMDRDAAWLRQCERGAADTNPTTAAFWADLLRDAKKENA